MSTFALTQGQIHLFEMKSEVDLFSTMKDPFFRLLDLTSTVVRDGKRERRCGYLITNKLLVLFRALLETRSWISSTLKYFAV